jgi:(R,R)-butanediol dehydrogenase/meso-butanediol dehydrogenase/diacetyl reductase
MQFARVAGARQTIVIEPSPVRRALAADLGAEVTVSPDEAAAAIHERTTGLGADVVMECTGVPQLLQTAVDMCRVGGVVGLVSFLAQPATINAARWLAREITLVASNAFTHDDCRVKTKPLHTRTVALHNLDSTLRDLATATTEDIKVLVSPASVTAR